jgi:hypothetical protein
VPEDPELEEPALAVPPVDGAWPPLPEPPPECWARVSTGAASRDRETRPVVVKMDHAENVRFMTGAPPS